MLDLFSLLVHDIYQLPESLGGLHDRLDTLAIGARAQCAVLHDVLMHTIEAIRGELDEAARHRGLDAREDLEAFLENVALLAELLQKLSDLETHRESRRYSRRTDVVPSLGGYHPSPDIPPLPSGI